MDTPQLPTFLLNLADTSPDFSPPPAHDLNDGCILYEAQLLFAQRRCFPGQKVSHPKYGHGTVRTANGHMRDVDFEYPVEHVNDQGDLERCMHVQLKQVAANELELEIHHV
jgi:hypothetical protein